MKLHRSAVLWLALGALVWADSSEAAVRKSGITGGAFLKIGVGARAVALGSAYTTVPGDATQMFWNPAGITLPRGRSQVTYSYNQWIADLTHHAVGVTRRFSDLGTFGIGMINLSLDGIDNGDGLDRDRVPAFLDDSYTGFRDSGSGSYDYSDMALQVTWARDVTDRLALGATGKMVQQSIDGVSASALALDFGAIYHVGFRNARLGARINNLGSDLTFYNIGAPLPLAFSVGAAIEVYEQQGVKVTLLSDATKPQDGEQLLFSAAEVEVLDYLALRGGYKLNYSGEEDSKVDEVTGGGFDAPRTEEGASFGMGVHVPWANYDVTVDYAYTQFGILDSVHRVSLLLGF